MTRAGGQGFSLLELVVVVCLVAILSVVALDRLFRYQELAEKAAMEQTVSVLRSALALQFAARISRGAFAETPKLAEENPMDWLADRPVNYLGALYAPTDAEVARGNWYYERKSGELVYRLRMTRYFTPGPDGREQIRFRTFVNVAVRGATQSPEGQRELSELAIRPTRPYSWEPMR